MLYNPAEIAMTGFSQAAPQVNPVAMNAAKDSQGLGYVPNDLLSAFGGPAGAFASALSTPDPSLTTSVNLAPDVKYGERYTENLVGQSKLGAFNVSSGKSSSNAEQRGQDTAKNSVWMWLIIAVVVIAGIWFIRRR